MDTSSGEFREWFGKSAIANNDGSPRVVFTGQPRGLDAIPPTQRSELPAGHAFFTSSKDVAAMYAGTHENELSGKTAYSLGRNGSVYSVYLSIQKPMDLDKFDEDEWVRALLPDVDVDGDGYTQLQLAEALGIERVREYDEDREKYVTIGYDTPGGNSPDKDFDLLDAIDQLWSEKGGSGMTLEEALSDSPSGKLMVLFPEAGQRLIEEHGYDGFLFSDSEIGGTTIVPFEDDQVRIIREHGNHPRSASASP